MSGGSTQAAVSRDVRVVLRGVPNSDRTVVDVSGDSARSGNRFAPLSEPSGESRRGDRRRRLVLVSQHEVPESDHEWDSDTDSIGGASDVEGVDVVEPTCRGPHHFGREIAGSCEVVCQFGRSEFVGSVRESTTTHAIGPTCSAREVSISHESLFPGDIGRSGGQQRSQDSERLEVALGPSKNAALSASSRRHSSSQEVGGQVDTVPGR